LQFSLFGKHPLFDETTIQRRRNEWRQIPIPGLAQSSEALQTFSSELRKRAIKAQKETSLEQKFNDAFFVDLLGYHLYPGLENHWTAWPKPSTSITHLPGEPDLLLGISRDEEFETVAVVELKKPGTPLDAPQPSYDNRTPVEQAFSYGRKIATCRWIIVSDMQFVRLYSIETMDAYHEIDLWAVAPHGEDERHTVAEAVHLLSFENLVEHGADSPTSRLLLTVREEQAFFRDGFYKVYSDIRADLLEALEQWSAGRHDRGTLVLAVQRLLDRLLFIYFCEDHPDRLLRHRLLEEMVEGAVKQPGPSATKAYDSVKQLFRDLDTGVTTQYWSVPKYNGELFKPHHIVDELLIDDSLHIKRYSWKSPRDKSNRSVNGIFGLHVFDFWRELDRDLLRAIHWGSDGTCPWWTSRRKESIRNILYRQPAREVYGPIRRRRDVD
jgi:hypothetical protein